MITFANVWYFHLFYIKPLIAQLGQSKLDTIKQLGIPTDIHSWFVLMTSKM
jgi:hypothetical protein